MFKPILAAAALAVTSTALVAPAPAMAQSRSWHQDDGYYGYQQVGYRDNRRHRNANRYRHSNRRCSDKGNGGLAIGGVVGALAGNQIAGRGDRTLGTVLGAGVGALAGRAIDRSDGAPCRR